MSHEHIELLKTSLIQEHCKSFTCGKLTLLMLSVNPLLTTAHYRSRPTLDKFFDFLLLYTHNDTIYQS